MCAEVSIAKAMYDYAATIDEEFNLKRFQGGGYHHGDGYASGLVVERGAGR